MTEKELFAPNNVPTILEVYQLPIWARLALSARVARLTVPYFSEVFPEDATVYIDNINECIGTGEKLEGKNFTQIKDENAKLFNSLNRFRPNKGQIAETAGWVMSSASMVCYVAHDIYAAHFEYITEDTVSCLRYAAILDNSLIPEIRKIFNEMLNDTFKYKWLDVSVEPIFFYRKEIEKKKEGEKLSATNLGNYDYLMKEVKNYLLLSNDAIMPFEIIFSRYPVHSHQHNFKEFKRQLWEYQTNENIFCETYLQLLILLGNSCSMMHEHGSAKLYYFEAYNLLKRMPSFPSHKEKVKDVLFCLILWERNYGCASDELNYLNELLTKLKSSTDSSNSLLYLRCLDRYFYLLTDLGLFDEFKAKTAFFNVEGLDFSAGNELRMAFAELKFLLTFVRNDYLEYKQQYHQDLDNGIWPTKAVNKRYSTEDQFLGSIQGLIEHLKTCHSIVYSLSIRFSNFGDLQTIMYYLEVCAESKSLLNEFQFTPNLLSIQILLSEFAEQLEPLFQDFFVGKRLPFPIHHKLAKGLSYDGSLYDEKKMRKIYNDCEEIGRNKLNNPARRKRMVDKAFPNFYFDFLFDYGLCILEKGRLFYIDFFEFSSEEELELERDSLDPEIKDDIESAGAIFGKSINFLKFYIEKNFIFLPEDDQIAFIRRIKEIIEFMCYFFAVLYPNNKSKNLFLYELNSIFKGTFFNKNQTIQKLINSIDDANLKQSFLSLKNQRNFAKITKTATETVPDFTSIRESETNMINNLRFAMLNLDMDPVLKLNEYEYLKLANVLPKDACFIDIIRIRSPFDSFQSMGFKWKDIGYIAIIISPRHGMETVLLSNGYELENNLFSEYQKYLKGESDVQTGIQLFENFWQPIHSKVRDCKQVYLSPEGIYSKINMETFRLSDSTYVFDLYDIHFLNSKEEIFEHVDFATTGIQTASLIGNIDYGHPDTTDEFLPLERSKDEIDNIKVILENSNCSCTQYTGSKIEKSTFVNIDANILHFSTHCFYNKEESHSLLKSCLVLSGVNNLEKDKIFKSQNVLNGIDVMAMHMEKVNLVVLSGCESFLGDEVFGQGTYSLPYAFRSSGAKFVIASVAEVSDFYTFRLMELFYNYLMAEKVFNPKKALKRAQNDIRKIRPEPYYWGNFIFLGVV